MKKPEKKISKVSINNIFNKAGGSFKIALLCGVSQFATAQWLSRGRIPQRFWYCFIDKKLATVNQLQKLSEQSKTSVKTHRKRGRPSIKQFQELT